MTFSDNIRLWDAKTGVPLSPSLQKYADVECGAFSLDGKRFVSSDYNTIQLSDVEIGMTLRPPVEGYVDTVSPDGMDQDLTISPHDAQAIPNHDLQHFIHTSALPVSIREEDRWVVIGSNERLLFWVPPIYDPCWCPPRVRWVAPLDTPLDLSHMAHGVSWKSCYRTHVHV
ncbi:hypothetical protein DFH29DRAFT_938897 [Suillus ampliporus]|nr:hypothetical protein DFH29DRAFT_938897 [Suillus ampliporus]